MIGDQDFPLFFPSWQPLSPLVGINALVVALWNLLDHFAAYQDAATSTSSMKKAVVTLKLLAVWALKTNVTVSPV